MRTTCLSLIAVLLILILLGCSHRTLGVNRAPEPPDDFDRGYAAKRGLDFVDIFTINGGLGLGLHAEAHATHALAVGLGTALSRDVGLSERPRHSVTWETHLSEITLGPVQIGAVWQNGEGAAAPELDAEWHMPVHTTGLQTPGDWVYQQVRDFWAPGLSATPGFFSFQFELHPLQLADFFVGIGGFDPLGDDLIPFNPHRHNPRVEPLRRSGSEAD